MLPFSSKSKFKSFPVNGMKIQVDKKFAAQTLRGPINRRVDAEAALASSLAEVVEQASNEIAQTLHEMQTVIVDGEKAHSDTIMRARMHEADCTHARHVANREGGGDRGPR